MSSSTGILALPQDVLAKCISLAAEHDPSGVLAISRTCRRFRDASLQVLKTVERLDLRPQQMGNLKSQRQSLLYRPCKFGAGHQAISVDCIYAVQGLVCHCPRLRSLDVSGGYTYVTDGLLKLLSEHCKDLEEVRLDSCQLISGRGLWYLCRGLRRLRVLSLESCIDLMAASNLDLRLPKTLTWLNIAWCRRLQPSILMTTWPQLQHADLHGCEEVGDAVMPWLLGVEVLDIAFTTVTDVGLKVLAMGASNLRRLTVARHELNLWRCGCYSSEGLLDFKVTRPDVAVRLVSV